MDLIPQNRAWEVAKPIAKQVPVSHQDPILLQLNKKAFMSESVKCLSGIKEGYALH